MDVHVVSMLEEPPLPPLPVVNVDINTNTSCNANSSQEQNNIIDHLPLSLIQVSPIITPSSTNATTSTRSCIHIPTDQELQNILSFPVVKLQLNDLCRQDYAGKKGIGNGNGNGNGGGLGISWYPSSYQYPQSKSTSTSTSKSKSSGKILNIGKGILYENDDRDMNQQILSEIMNQISSRGRLNQDQDQDQDSPLTSLPLIPAITLQSQDPTNDKGIPCFVQGFSIPYGINCNYANGIISNSIMETRSAFGSVSRSRVRMMDGTLVQILPPIMADPIHDIAVINEEKRIRTTFYKPKTTDYMNMHATSFHQEIQGLRNMVGRYDDDNHDDDDEVLLCFEQETVQALTIRMRMLMDMNDGGPIMVGTTHDAITKLEEQRRRRRRMDRMVIQKRFTNKSIHASSHDNRQQLSAGRPSSTRTGRGSENDQNRESNTRSRTRTRTHNNDSAEFDHGGALTVHDPVHGSGKTLLVTTIAKKILKCNAVHIINVSALFAQYGASGTDAALESLLHGIVLSAAVNVNHSIGVGDDIGSICIILDHLETFIPPTMSRSASSDPAIPTLNSIAAYLSKLVHSIRHDKTFPYPTKNPLYNMNGHSGFVFPVKVCLVGIVTCDDDGGRKAAGGSNYNMGTVLDTLGENRYRIPTASIEAQCQIFTKLVEKDDVVFSNEVKSQLPELVASVTNSRGSAFHSAASKLLYRLQQRSNDYDDNEESKMNGTKVLVANINDVRFALSLKIRDNQDGMILKPSSKTKDAHRDIFSSIGGNGEAKKALEDALALDEGKILLLHKFGLSPPCGVMMYGPPGTGKTLLAKATAQMMQKDSSDIPNTSASSRGTFMSLNASDIVRSEVGQSEKLIVSVFEKAIQNAPSVIFIDEFQALFTSRDGAGGVGKGSGRLSSTLLQCMDDISRWRDMDESVLEHQLHDRKPTTQNRVVVIGATNTPWMVDKAFLRPGRFDKVVHVALPTQAEREAILRVYVGQMLLHPNTSIEEICRAMAKLANGFSGADLAALVRSAAIRCLTDTQSNNNGGGSVELRHFLDAFALDMPQPSNRIETVDRLAKWRP